MADVIPRFRPGPLLPEHLNRLVDLANRLEAALPGGALQRMPGGGWYVEPCREFVALKLTGGGTGGLYDWTRVLPTASSPFWTDTTDTGTGAGDWPAIELNGNASIDTSGGVYVWAWREPGVKGWLFQGDACP